jgi:hypothetical protein
MATDNSNVATGSNSAAASESQSLDVRDVLSGIVPEGGDADALGVYIAFETVGNNTVISVDADGPGPLAPVPIVTLANITGKTLQDLLNDVPADV